MLWGRLCILAVATVLLVACGGGSSSGVASGSTSLGAAAVVVPPSITQQPLDLSLPEGADGSISVRFSGTQPLTVEWELSTDGTTFISAAKAQGGTASEIRFSKVTMGHNGMRYRVAISNSAGTVVSNAVKVTVIPAEVAPSILQAPVDVNCLGGAGASFLVTASGTSLKYQWQVSTDGGKTFQIAPGNSDGGNYLISKVDAQSNGYQYRVVVSNSLGSVTSSPATLIVHPAADAPYFTLQPLPQSTVGGGEVSFTATAVGNPSPRLIWAIGTDFLTDGVWERGICAGITVKGANTNLLVLSNIPLKCDGAVVGAFADNGLGIWPGSSPVILTVAPPVASPTIETPPSSQTVSEGQSATFTVVAKGTGLTYQWQRNGTNIAGATSSSYTTPPTNSSADQGALYAVVVSNAGGSLTSQSATLSVQNKPTPPVVNSDFELFESLALRGGGEYRLGYILNFNGAQVPGAHYVSSMQTRLSKSPRDWGAQLVRGGALDSLSATLSVVGSTSVSRRMVNGAIFIMPVESPLMRISYVPTGVQVDVFAADGATVIQSELRSNYSYGTLSGLLGSDNSDFARSYRDLYYLGDRFRFGNSAIFGPDASYLPGAGYLKYSVKSKDDRLLPSDCSGATTTAIPSPCVTNSTLSQALSAGITVAGVTYNSSGGAMRNVLGTPVWVASVPRTPTVRNETVTYRMFFERSGNVYTGWFIADGTALTGGMTPPVIRAAAPADQWQALPFRVEFNTQTRESLVKAMASGSASAIQVTPSPSSFTVSGVAGKMGSGIQQTLRAWLSANPTGPVYPVLVASSVAIQAGATAVSQNADGSFSATVTVSPTLAAGTYQGTLTLGLCQEPTCTNRYNVLGGVVNYTINVSP